MTVPAVTVPVPRGGPEISTPPISTPPLKTPPIETPVGTVPSVSVPSVKVGSVTVPAVKTVPESSGGEPPAGGGGTAKPTGASDPPSAGGSSKQPARPAAPPLAVRGTTIRHSERGAPAATRPAAADAPDRRARPPRSRATSTTAHVAPNRVDRHTAPAIGVLDERAARALVPVADKVERHDADARPFVDALGPALDVAPLLMALALGGALCVASRQMRRPG